MVVLNDKSRVVNIYQILVRLKGASLLTRQIFLHYSNLGCWILMLQTFLQVVKM